MTRHPAQPITGPLLALITVLTITSLGEVVLLLGWVTQPDATWWHTTIYPRVGLLADQRDQWAAIGYSTLRDIAQGSWGYSTFVPTAAVILTSMRAVSLGGVLLFRQRPRPAVSTTAAILLGLAGLAALTGALTQGFAHPTPINAVWAVGELAAAWALWRVSNHTPRR